MTFDTWLTFIIATLIFAIIPGPTVIVLVGQAIAHGKKSVMPLVLGVLCGDFVAMSLSFVGIGALLATSATLYGVLKWLGVGYLLYLGIKTWQKKPTIDIDSLTKTTASKFSMFRSAFIVTALNPKDILFFVAFLPQFINPTFAAEPQLLVLMVSFLFVIFITDTLFAFLAGTIRGALYSHSVRKKINKISGAALIGAGFWVSMK